ncbi:MAG TPA: histidine phosphatase family protein [Gemmatimonadaceae bacterium]|nr:histidine phosphatase family protein [Gemmatimonadaceae bacterium]
MRHHLLRAALAAALSIGAAVPALRAQASTVVLLVRHAEKAAPSGDPVLSAAGETRARALAAALADARVDAVITTQLRRTALTAAPLAEERRLVPIVVPVGRDTEAHARAVAAAVRARPAGEAVLVVGHSNTVPAIIAALGGPRLPEMCDTEYSTLFTLVLPPAGQPRLIRASYGAADAPAPEECARAMSGSMRP